MQMLKRLGLVIAVLACLPSGLRAQTTNGIVTGVITDSSGAVVTRAQVSVVNRDTGQERTALSDASGLYVVPQLAPVVYTLTAMKQGFASVKQNNLQLLVNQSFISSVNSRVPLTAQTLKSTTRAP